MAQREEAPGFHPAPPRPPPGPPAPQPSPPAHLPPQLNPVALRSHDQVGKGRQSRWHCDHVDVTQLAADKSYAFKHRAWLNAGESAELKRDLAPCDWKV
jgi:hypothetical protein